MGLTQAVSVCIATYLSLAFLLLAMSLNNIIPGRAKAKYDLRLGGTLKFLKDPKRAYWVIRGSIYGRRRRASNNSSLKQDCTMQPQQTNNVILLHGWTRNSGRMAKRASIYKLLGYNVYLVDARSHGYSDHVLIVHMRDYAHDAMEVATVENLDSYVVHGSSFGAATGAILLRDDPRCKALIGEGMPTDLRRVFDDVLRFVHAPAVAFRWVKSIAWSILPFESEPNSAVTFLHTLDKPFFLMHGDEDPMLPIEQHFDPVDTQLHTPFAETCGQRTWRVPRGRHSNAPDHPEYLSRLLDFLVSINKLYQRGTPLENEHTYSLAKFDYERSAFSILPSSA